MEKKKSRIRSRCPSCKEIIELDRRYKLQEMISCPYCKQVLEVVRVYPQVLDFPEDPYLPVTGRYPRRLF